MGVRGRRATVCRPPTPNCRLPFVHVHTHCTDPGVALHPFGVRQSHLSDIGLLTPLGRARNSVPLRAHSPTLPCIFGISPAIRISGASFVRRPLNVQSPWGVGAVGRVGERGTGDTTKTCALPAPRVPPRSTFNVPRSTHNAPTLNPNRLRIPPCTLDDRGVSNTDVPLLPVTRRKTKAVRGLHEGRLTFLNSGKIPQAALSYNSYCPNEQHT